MDTNMEMDTGIVIQLYAFEKSRTRRNYPNVFFRHFSINEIAIVCIPLNGKKT